MQGSLVPSAGQSALSVPHELLHLWWQAAQLLHLRTAPNVTRSEHMHAVIAARKGHQPADCLNYKLGLHSCCTVAGL